MSEADIVTNTAIFEARRCTDKIALIRLSILKSSAFISVNLPDICGCSMIITKKVLNTCLKNTWQRSTKEPPALDL